jgi:hypothetical protein
MDQGGLAQAIDGVLQRRERKGLALLFRNAVAAHDVSRKVR